MPPNHPDLHDAVWPDFTTDEDAVAHLTLINSGVPENAAAAALAQVWFFNNKRDKTEWDRVVANEAHTEEEARQLATAAKELLRQQEQAEKEAALTEEHKKHKTKYIPILNTQVPFDLIGLPAKYTRKQMDGGHYVKPFYFTNQGLMDAQEVAATEDDDTFVWKQGDSGSPALVEATKRGLKTKPLPDEKLSWEQFFEATPCFIQFMKRYNWPNEATQGQRTQEPTTQVTLGRRGEDRTQAMSKNPKRAQIGSLWALD